MISKTAVPTRYETAAKSRGWFLSVLVGTSMSCTFVLLAQTIKMPRGTIAAKSVVRNVNATKDRPFDREWLMSANVNTAMTGGIVALEIAAAHLRFVRSAAVISPLSTRRHMNAAAV